MVLLRFAPSPTGPLHLGGLRTALYNHLYARRLGGKWILRIEDTDSVRAVPGSVDGIRSSLEWAGLHYDYGPGADGPHAPYFQSERLDLYHSYAHKLLSSGHAYRCFCSPDKLAATRERLARTGSNASYDKTCLNLSEEEVARRVKAGEKSIVRLNDGIVPDRVTPQDIVFGSLKDSHASLPTDPVLLKSDLFPTYHLASVVDDHEMGITHVLRGEEWLPSLPLHLDIYACLNIKPPHFAHLPILLNPDGSKMSKRKGDVQVMDYIRRGWEPAAVLNWLALAGWGTISHHKHDHDSSVSSSSSSSEDGRVSPAPDSTTLMTLEELIKEFSLTALTHRRTVLDPIKLEYLNKHHLMKMMHEELPDSQTSDSSFSQMSPGLAALAEKAHPTVKDAFPGSRYTAVGSLGSVIQALEGRLVNIKDIPSLAPYFFVEPDLQGDEAKAMMKNVDVGVARKVLHDLHSSLEKSEGNWTSPDLAAFLHHEHERLVLKQKTYMTIVRYAITGMKAGPSAGTIMAILGKERTLERLSFASAYL